MYRVRHWLSLKSTFNFSVCVRSPVNLPNCLNHHPRKKRTENNRVLWSEKQNCQKLNTVLISYKKQTLIVQSKQNSLNLDYSMKLWQNSIKESQINMKCFTVDGWLACGVVTWCCWDGVVEFFRSVSLLPVGT